MISDSWTNHLVVLIIIVLAIIGIVVGLVVVPNVSILCSLKLYFYISELLLLTSSRVTTMMTATEATEMATITSDLSVPCKLDLFLSIYSLMSLTLF